MTRQEDIAYSFLESVDRIWPSSVTSKHGHPFMKALVEVLERLPDDAYNVVESRVGFVVYDHPILSFNVPFERYYPPSPNGIKVRFDTVVVFEEALRLPHKALVALIAHELAHSLVGKGEHKEVEAAANALAVEWGFQGELQAFEMQ